ncbi:MAG: phosphatase PAP2 family protein [Bacillota bacterium]|nr:phosphatase PAP2 family protein [Bacillota bacterium]
MPDFIQNIDEKLLFFIQDHFHNGILDKVMPLVTDLGNWGFLWLTVSIILIISKKYRKIGLMAMASFLLSFLLSENVIKYIVQRPRPFVLFDQYKLLIPKPSNFSFPSSHSTEAFATAAILFKKSKVTGIVFLVIAALIAFSRLYLFVHFPSDVLGGIITGLICAFIVNYTAKHIYKNKAPVENTDNKM